MPRSATVELSSASAACSLCVRRATSVGYWTASCVAVSNDLWSGNVLFTTKGPAIIDPAVYRHYPAVDVAMLTLFGSPGEAFFDAYWNGDAPTSWPRREALFQLYPLLNHLVLFGAGYRSAVERCVARLESFA